MGDIYTLINYIQYTGKYAQYNANHLQVATPAPVTVTTNDVTVKNSHTVTPVTTGVKASATVQVTKGWGVG